MFCVASASEMAAAPEVIPVLEIVSTPTSFFVLSFYFFEPLFSFFALTFVSFVIKFCSALIFVVAFLL